MATQKGKRTGRSNRELSQQTKHELLAVGAREFFNHPFAANPFRGLTLDRIARLAGKSRNTVYLHWQDKDAYLADLTRWQVQAVEASVSRSSVNTSLGLRQSWSLTGSVVDLRGDRGQVGRVAGDLDAFG